MNKRPILPIERIESRILIIRNQKVMIDRDLAELYGIPTKRLNEQVRRNRGRFPSDFMFQLSVEEKEELVANCDHLAPLRFSKSLPYAFTEHGAVMAASVLNTPRALEVSIFVVRAFIKLRELAATHRELEITLKEIEDRLENHDSQIVIILDAIRELMKPPEPKKLKIGFGVRDNKNND